MLFAHFSLFLLFPLLSHLFSVQFEAKLNRGETIVRVYTTLFQKQPSAKPSPLYKEFNTFQSVTEAFEKLRLWSVLNKRNKADKTLWNETWLTSGTTASNKQEMQVVSFILRHCHCISLELNHKWQFDLGLMCRAQSLHANVKLEQIYHLWFKSLWIRGSVS